jgi:hypothetical protein
MINLPGVRPASHVGYRNVIVTVTPWSESELDSNGFSAKSVSLDHDLELNTLVYESIARNCLLEKKKGLVTDDSHYHCHQSIEFIEIAMVVETEKVLYFVGSYSMLLI